MVWFELGVLQVLLLMLAIFFARWLWRRRVDRLTEWLRRLRVDQAAPVPKLPRRGFLVPLAEEAGALARLFSQAQASAEHEARLRDRADPLWTAERLREHVRAKLQGRPLVVVSNREPYRHVRRGSKIEALMPASGLVTGLEPLLRACGGTWVAYGDGDADRDTADARGRLKVPPGDSQYTLRRVWLSKEEENGYYDGFSNEGLWPLCHIVHARPVFRPADWERYQQVNAKFAEAVLEEITGLEEPCLLLQDYHFTLLPRLLKEKRPDARVALFWHIPWPNPEAFGICPWQREMLEGMLGADLIGFHTQQHCNNFLETVDAVLESRVDWEHFAVSRRDHATMVKPFPISVDFPPPAAGAAADREAEKRKLLAAHKIDAEHVAVGVDRLDYTKGILERFRGVERFLEKHPSYQGHFTLFQLSAPSRANIPRYRQFAEEVEAEARRVNARFKGAGAPPIVHLLKHHSHAEIRSFYRAADACLVTPLHDGMNLVAKEFVAARDDERGALVLSCFTGAARELRDALIVNPYDVDETAEAIRAAVEMSAEEQAMRMARLRKIVRENNVYRWAGVLIADLAASLRPLPSLHGL